MDLVEREQRSLGLGSQGPRRLRAVLIPEQ
jgi:hypothetical protein